MTDEPTSTDQPQPAASDTEEDTPLTFWQMLGSTLAAAVGVQSSRNRHRDFTRGKASHFIFMGIAFTAIFVLAMIGLVSLILP